MCVFQMGLVCHFRSTLHFASLKDIAYKVCSGMIWSETYNTFVIEQFFSVCLLVCTVKIITGNMKFLHFFLKSENFSFFIFCHCCFFRMQALSVEIILLASMCYHYSCFTLIAKRHIFFFLILISDFLKFVQRKQELLRIIFLLPELCLSITSLNSL